ncbi:MAG: thiamine pyrophosphate-binding protein [Streptosporangiales bacterium]|nr:thiamine pyrophosphate-binding protein [Streptosporangiales bacterium]
MPTSFVEHRLPSRHAVYLCLPDGRVPGDTGVVLYDARYDRTGDLRHVLARDERHAAAMADAYARLTNRVGVVEVSSGGGTTYVVGGLGEAYASSVPLLVLVTDIHRDSRGTGALTEIDQRALFSAATKAQYVVESAADLPADVHDDTTAVPSHRPAADDDAVRRAGEILVGARGPAILAGGGVHTSAAYRQLADVAEALGAGVATTIHGKGAIAETHPCALGIAGNNGGGRGVNAFLAGADVVLLVGTRANATDTDSFASPPRTATVIAIDIDPDRAGRNYPGAHRLVGDAATVLGALAGVLSAIGSDERERRVAAIAHARDDRRTDPGVTPAAGQLLARDVVLALRDVAGDDTVVVADPGTPTPNLASHWTVRQPGRTTVVPRGHGPMGYAIPGAVGAAFARPGRPVLAFTADGSFAMACGELETVARFELPIVFVQFTNHSLGWIKMLQHLYTDRRYFGVDPGPIDAVGVARACGLAAVRVTDLDELRGTVREAFATGRPTYVDVEVPHLIDDVPPVPSWHRALDGDTTRPVY